MRTAAGAFVLAALIAVSAHAAKNQPVVNLRIHAPDSSVYVTIDAKGKLALREELPENAKRKPRKATKKVGKKAVEQLLADARSAGFFDLPEGPETPGGAGAIYRIQLTDGETTRTVTVRGELPAAFQQTLDGIERLYGKPLLRPKN